MNDREKVINGLECCTAELENNQHRDDFCAVCQYGDKNPDNWYCFSKQDLMRDALAMLKEQEPRVMTLEEVIESEVSAVVWLEDIDKPTVIAGLVDRVFTGTMVVDFQCVARTVTASFDDYGKRWRCWTSRPTEAEREAIPWDAQEQREYEAAVEMAEYCERYEPTYNADDGSM